MPSMGSNTMFEPIWAKTITLFIMSYVAYKYFQAAAKHKA